MDKNNDVLIDLEAGVVLDKRSLEDWADILVIITLKKPLAHIAYH